MNVVKKINRHLPDKLRENRALSGLCTIVYPMEKSFRRRINKAVKDCQSRNPEYVERALRKDMIHTYVQQEMEPEEYVKYNLYQKSESEKSEYISLNKQKRLFYNETTNLFPRSKYERFRMFQNFFKRDIVPIFFHGNEDTLYFDFISRNPVFIAKPVLGTQGRGVQKLLAKDVPDLSCLHEVVGEACLLEEVIQQGEELAKFHPSSVNTVRLATGMSKKGFSFLYAYMRVGNGGSIVDNVHSGGARVLINLEQGVFASDFQIEDVFFEYHPDTNLRCKGCVVPAWDQLCEIAKEAHETMPKQKLIGWDFAWTKSGIWDLVEANPLPDFTSYQMLTGKGIRPILKEAGLDE